MLIYSHSTPEILVASFRTKEQVKNSAYCNLIDDNLPDDISTLRGDDLIIREGTNTINLDIALALSFNAIRTTKSAIQFAKLLTLNGPNVDTKTLLYYVSRLRSSPFGYETIQHINNHFDFLNGDYKGYSIPGQTSIGSSVTEPTLGPDGYDTYTTTTNSNDNTLDRDFISTLKKLSKDCLTAPCNYLNYMGSYGSLGFTQQVLNTTTNNRADITNETQGVGVGSVATFNKLPDTIRQKTLELKQVLTTTFNKAVSTFLGTNINQTNGVPLIADAISYQAYSRAHTQVNSVLANRLGDCYRLNDFNIRYNPFNYNQNFEAQAVPGLMTGMPVGYNSQLRNSSLGTTQAEKIQIFTSGFNTYVPAKFGTPEEQAIKGPVRNSNTRGVYTYEEYIEGKSSYVTIQVPDTIKNQYNLQYGDVLYSETFRLTNGKLIPFRFTDVFTAEPGNFTPPLNVSIAVKNIITKIPTIDDTKTPQWQIGGTGLSQIDYAGKAQQFNPNKQIGIITPPRGYTPPNQTKQPTTDDIKAMKEALDKGVVENGLIAYSNFANTVINLILNKKNEAGYSNAPAPVEVWNNIWPTIRVLEQLAMQYNKGIPFEITSVYRSPLYNDTIRGAAKNSFHTRFNAIDFVASVRFYEILDRWRKVDNVFKGGLHYYSGQGFIHIDTRGVNQSW